VQGSKYEMPNTGRLEKESKKEQARFLGIPKGSAAEFATQTYISKSIREQQKKMM